MRGTVLFTTVSVMALLIIFLTGTLVLASASNSRAHKSYSTSQASYTARAAIDSFIESMARNGAIAAAVQEIATPGGSGATTKEVDIKVNDPSLGTIGYIDSHGEFQANKIILENVGGGEYEYINDKGESLVGSNSSITNGKWVQLDRVKVTASARVGSEIETVTAYIRKRAGNSITIPPTFKAPTVKGIQMTGAAGFPSGETISGGLGVNLGNLEADVCTKLRNQMMLETSLSFINSDLVWFTSNTEIRIKESNPAENQEGYLPYSQTIINGNLYLPNDQFVVLDYKMPTGYQDGDWTNKEVPYVYVNGVLTGDKGASVVRKDNTTDKVPFNIFAGTYVQLQNNSQLDSTNLYMMDTYEGDSDTYTVYSDVSPQHGTDANGNAVDYDTGSAVVTNSKRADGKFVKGDNYLGAGGTPLYKWAHSVLSSTNSTYDVGGSVFCNGRLTLTGVNIEGDVYVEGDCYIKGPQDVTIQGKLRVGGELHIDEPGKFHCDDFEHKLASSGGGAVPVTDVKKVENLYVPADTIDMSKMETISLDSTYKVNYVKWVPADHGTTTEAPFGVDLWGHAVADNEQIIYYKWTNDTVVTDEVANSANKFANNTSYDDLQADAEFDAVRSKIADIRYYVGSTDISKNVSHSDGGDIYYYGIPKVEGGYLYPVGEEADESETYYRNTETNAVVSQTYISGHTDVPEHYERLLIDGTPSGESADMNQYTYYRNNDNSNFTFNEADAYNSTVVTPAGAPFVYPKDMTREKIYGEYTGAGFTPAPDDTKIITTLQEARLSLGLSETGEVNPDAYPTKFDGTEGSINIESLPTAIENHEIKTESVFGGTVVSEIKDGSNNNITFAAINQSCKIKGDVVGDASRELRANGHVAVQKDKKQINGSQEAFKVLYFQPGTDDLYIYLDNVSDGESLAFIVDRNPATDGQVYFIVNGTLETGNKMMIIPSYYKKDITVNYTDDWGITYYGTYGSKFTIKNDSTFVGCFKMPYTKFEAKVKGQIPVYYVGEDGPYVDNSGNPKTMYPCIVGNALFSGVTSDNNFINCYTATGGGATSSTPSASGGTVKTEVGYFDIMYMLGS